MIVLSGGTGTPKLLQGLRRVIPEEDITVIVNTAEDISISGNLVSPDLDTVLYLFAGLLDDSKWWGVKNDTFQTYEALRKLGIHEKLMIGDADRALHIIRSDMMRNGASLTKATLKLSSMLGIKTRVLPMCDEKVDTLIETRTGNMHFQDFWVGLHGEPEVLDVHIKGIQNAKPSKAVIEALEKENNVIIGPSNPLTSIGPILAIKGMKKLLKGKKVIAISPIIGDSPVSGPAGKFMKARGFEVSSKGVAECYGDILDALVIDIMDRVNEKSIAGKAVRFDTLMTSVEKSEALAGCIIGLFKNI
jgi:LPPG:FO 2-phospho-L-lactate transferase